MKRVRQFIVLLALLPCCTKLLAQKDSTQALFKTPKFNIHYSYLQWEFGYTGFLFSNTYVDGIGVDLFGIVFNDDVDVAIGFNQGGKNDGSYRTGFIAAVQVQSYAGFYIKAEPMLFPDKLINISMPLKLGISSLTYSDTSIAAANGFGRHHRRPVTFPYAEPGVFGYVNIFPKVNMGVGLSYRIALSTSGSIPSSDYDNFIFSVLLRLKLYTKNTRKQAAKTNEYYQPVDRFQ